jgi:hypothetical protein
MWYSNGMDEVWDEFWKPLICRGQEIPNYYVSNYGRVRKYCGETFKELRLGNKQYKERGDYQSVSVRGKHERVHRLVAETFLPIDNNPPIPLEDWLVTPLSARNIIKSTLFVDHIDNNPFNNRASNLRWVTPLENNSHWKAKNYKE